MSESQFTLIQLVAVSAALRETGGQGDSVVPDTVRDRWEGIRSRSHGGDTGKRDIVA